MTFKATPSIFVIYILLLIGSSFATNDADDDVRFRYSLFRFSRNLFTELLSTHSEKNIIYSPFAIQTSLAMISMGADGQTAAEINRCLSVKGQRPKDVSLSFYNHLVKLKNNQTVSIANRIYVAKDLQLQTNFQQLLEANFFSRAENIDFSQKENSANVINTWVETKTNGDIKNLITPDFLSVDMRIFMLSAIHFKGDWEIPFPSKNTNEDDFFYTQHKSKKTPFMVNTDIYNYQIFPRLDATGVRLFYKDSGISMVIILPNSRTGLPYLLEDLQDIGIATLVHMFRNHNAVTIHLPKFSVEFQEELKPTLQKMGIEHLFKDANLSKMFKTDEPLAISSVLHKAVIDVTEMGTEAEAVTGIPGTSRMDLFEAFTFKCDHPFYYAIVDGHNAKLFEGSVVKL